MRWNRTTRGAALIAAATTLAVMSSARFTADAVAQETEASEQQPVFAVDSVHSSVVFRIGHMGVAYSYGRFNDPTGTYNIDLAKPGESFVNITLDVNKIDTANENRDKHLRSPDFFNAEEFPTITFTSTSAEKAHEKSLKLTGDLTLLGVTRPVEANLEYVGEAETRQGFKSGFEATFTIKRSEFGMSKYLEGNALSDEVTLYVTIEGKKM